MTGSSCFDQVVDGLARYDLSAAFPAGNVAAALNTDARDLTARPRPPLTGEESPLRGRGREGDGEGEGEGEGGREKEVRERQRYRASPLPRHGPTPTGGQILVGGQCWAFGPGLVWYSTSIYRPLTNV